MEGNRLLTNVRNRADLLRLIGMHEYSNQTVHQLRATLTRLRNTYNLRRGATVNDFNEAVTNRMIRAHMNPIGVVYNSHHTRDRLEYERFLSEVEDREAFNRYLREFIRRMRNLETFTVNVSDDYTRRLAFLQAIRSLSHNRQLLQSNMFNPQSGSNARNSVLRITEHDMQGNSQTFLLTPNRNINTLIKRLNSEVIDEPDSVSDDRYQVASVHPIVSFTFKAGTDVEEFDPSVYEQIDGEFFPYTNKTPIDLSVLQIYDRIDAEYYKDSCFVYACIQSKLFTSEEIDYLRVTVRTRKLPQRLIKQIAETFKCHIIIKYIDEKRDIRSQIRVHIDTTKLAAFKGQEWNRSVTMVLYKKHYMLDTTLPVSTYYVKHRKELDEQFPDIELSKRMLIKEVSNGRPKYGKGTRTLPLLRVMFSENCFKPITAVEYDLLKTREHHNLLPDFTKLSYSEELCTRPVSSEFKQKQWSRIYYADFETDPTVSPHEPYLCCIVSQKEGRYERSVLKGPEIGADLLNVLEDNSLTYFHNLKYDACFFINEARGYDVKLLQRSGTLLQVVISKRSKNAHKKLTFVNSYSIIPAALSKFSDMFGLSVSKDLMAYKLYTRTNRDRRVLDLTEFYDAYDDENSDRKTAEQLQRDHEQIRKNAEVSGSLVGTEPVKSGITSAERIEQIDIMKYAEFYCMKDCIVLMKGMMKFNEDLQAVYKSTNTELPDATSFVSISAIGYAFARAYGCFEGCYELSGKPQEFILRCVNGGRCMTANNEKQWIEAKLQDFDARSLYPSAGVIMPGVAKGVPKVITDVSNIWSYDTFFVEINIKSLKCKNSVPYRFGQIYVYNSKSASQALCSERTNTGSKKYCNEPVNNFYIDKRGLQDLLDAYEVEYEVIRGYYFDEGFNSRINEFIRTLYDLRARYVREKNPLEKTIKLLLNSIYGKSILKATYVETRCIDRSKLERFIRRNYNYIEDIHETQGIGKVYARVLKPINRHFNLPQFGASILSWSKHLMNRVMVLAEQSDIPIFYQDTDSMHLLERDVPRLASLFKDRYGAELIGADLTQFHEDFDGFSGSVGKIHSRKLIALGKKSYLDVLVDEQGQEGYHIRLKGIPNQCILNYCARNNITVETLYERMYRGQSVTFNILDGSNCFRKNKVFQQINLDRFTRTVKF